MASYSNREIAQLLSQVAAAYEVKGESLFRIRAYNRAADAVEHATSEIKDLWEANKLETLAGIGPAIAQHLDEYFRTGRVNHFEIVKKNLPQGMFPLLEIPGVGPKTAFKLAKELKLTKPERALADLGQAGKNGKIACLEGFGDHSQQAIMEGLKRLIQQSKQPERILLPRAEEVASRYLSYLKEEPAVKRADLLGSLRRRVATIGDIDIAVATNEPAKAVNHFSRYQQVEKIIDAGLEKASVLLKNGYRVDLKVGHTQSYGALLQHFTGSKSHNIRLREIALERGLSLSEHGIKLQKGYRGHPTGKMLNFPNEEKFYAFLGMSWIPPELRENTGEINAAIKGKLRTLVKEDQIKGDLHVHSEFEMETSHDRGQSKLADLITTAKEMGYQYLGIADHNPSFSSLTENKIMMIIRRRNQYIDQFKLTSENSEKSKAKRVKKVNIINLLEVDIRTDGSLAVPKQALRLVDGIIASIHSNFSLSKTKMTERILAAIKEPRVKIIGHPTGRLIQKREAYELDWDRLFNACLKHDVALEINAHPLRLDLPDFLVREALKKQVKLVLGSDSHSVAGLKMMRYGLGAARRGWATSADILNTRSYSQLVRWLKK